MEMNDHEASREGAPMNLQTLWSLFGDDEETIREILETFAVDLRKNCQALHDALAARERRLFGRVAHSMKGASSNVGADTFAAICSKAEQRAAEASWQELESFVKRIDNEAGRLQSYVATALKGRLTA